MRRGSRAFLGALGAATVASLLIAAGATASYHLTKIREVSPGASSDTSYVELQAWFAGENYLGGHTIKLYNATALTHTFTFPSSPVPAVPNGANQATVLVGDSNAPGSPDFTEAGFVVNAAGGAACFDAIPVDCVSWGSGTSAALPGTVGNPAAALSSGMALRRTIAPGCPTLLETTDDSDDSATDFSLTTPDPRNNSVTPTEMSCAGAGGGPTGYPAPGASTTPAPAPRKKCKKPKRRAAAAKKCKKRR